MVPKNCMLCAEDESECLNRDDQAWMKDKHLGLTMGGAGHVKWQILYEGSQGAREIPKNLMPA